MSDIHALSGAYATDALDDLERHAFERHLQGCPICFSEVAGLSETAALLAETCMMTPPASLRGQVLAAAALSRPLPPVLTSLSDHAERRRSRRPSRLTALAAAAAAVVAVGLGATVIGQVRGDDSSEVTVSAVDRVLGAADAQTYSQAAQGGGTITVVRSASLNRAVLRTSGLAEVGPDQTREMWLLHGGSYLPAGYLPSGPDHDILLDGDPASARGFGMTIEPATGSATPSADIVALVPFTSA